MGLHWRHVGYSLSLREGSFSEATVGELGKASHLSGWEVRFPGDSPMSLYVGTSGWSYPDAKTGWRGSVYPPGTRDELAYYAGLFKCVEVNSSFYRPPTPAMAQGWVRRTPLDFRFTVKLWQKFTHPEMYAEAAHRAEVPTPSDVDLFKKGIAPLAEAGRLGALLLQFPPSFHATEQGRDRLAGLLDAFAGPPLVVEVRHRSWISPETDALLVSKGASLAVIDEPQFPTSAPQDFSPRWPLFYLRLHGRNREKWWERDAGGERYNYLYTEDELRPFAAFAKTAADAGRTAYVLFNNHFGGKAVQNAIDILRILGQPVPSFPTRSAKEPQLIP